MKFRAVTAFYDIGRAHADGRGVQDYLRWLNATLRLPVEFTIYLDPSQDASMLILKPSDRVVRLAWSELVPARWLSQIEAICAQRDKFESPNDLTYRLPKYGPTNFAKLDLLAREATTDDDCLVWIDAGASRHTGYDFAGLRPRRNALERLMRNSDLAIGARHHLYDYLLGRAHSRFAGRCQTLTTGTVVVVRASAASRVRDAIYRHVENEWLPNGLWDTEQTAIGEVILAGGVAVAIPEEDRDWLGVLGSLYSRPGISWMGLRWDTPRGKYYNNALEDYLYAVRANLVRAYRRAFVLKSRDGSVSIRLPRQGTRHQLAEGATLRAS